MLTREHDNKWKLPVNSLNMAHLIVKFGNPTIDLEHLKLIKQIEHVYQCVIGNSPPRDLWNSVTRLIDRAKLHFKGEAYYIHGSGALEPFEFSDDHQALIWFLKEIRRYVIDENARARTTPDDVKAFLEDWMSEHLSDHIRKMTN